MFQLDKKTYVQVSGVIFLVLGVAWALAVYNGMDTTIAGWDFPEWANWAGAVVGLFLAWTAYKHNS